MNLPRLHSICAVTMFRKHLFKNIWLSLCTDESSRLDIANEQSLPAPVALWHRPRGALWHRPRGHTTLSFYATFVRKSKSKAFINRFIQAVFIGPGRHTRRYAEYLGWPAASKHRNTQSELSASSAHRCGLRSLSYVKRE